MQWRRAGQSDATLLWMAVKTAAGPDGFAIADAAAFLSHWIVELAEDRDHVLGIAAVLPPADPGHRRGFGAWWQVDPDLPSSVVLTRLAELAQGLPDFDLLQVSVPSADQDKTDALVQAGFSSAFPIWTMRHDGQTFLYRSMPAPLHLVRWSAIDPESFHAAYIAAYADQRLVEPHGATTWQQLGTDDSFLSEVSAIAISSNGEVAAFVLCFSQRTSVELGPIGTVPGWRGLGVSSALLSDVLDGCRRAAVTSVELTVDGDSRTGAQEMYRHHGFAPTEALIAFHLHLGQRIT